MFTKCGKIIGKSLKLEEKYVIFHLLGVIHKKKIPEIHKWNDHVQNPL